MLTPATGEEAEYPEGLCRAIAEACAQRCAASTQRLAGLEYAFVEIFSGPKAPLTNAIQVRLSAVLAQQAPEGRSQAEPQAPPAKRSRLIKVGRAGNAMVREEQLDSRGLPSIAQETQPKRETAKAKRERENLACIGGLRAPWRAVEKLQLSQQVGILVRKALEQAIDSRPELLEAAGGDPNFDAESVRQKDAVEEARARVAAALGVVHPQPLGKSHVWRPHLVEGWVTKAGDPEVDLAPWCRSGAPLGIVKEVIPRGVFPRVDPGEATAELAAIYTKLEPRANYKSYEEAQTLVDGELARLRRLLYVEEIGTWEDVVKRFGLAVTVSKLAAVIKERPDKSIKVRLIVDFLRSGVNALLKAGERVVLPRLRDVLRNIMWMQAKAEGGDDVELFVADFMDAFHTLPVSDEEKHLQVFMSKPGVFEMFVTVIFGAKTAPLVWGRAAALLMRSGQALFDPTELQVECYVDDPLAAIRGDAYARLRRATILLTWWRVLGPNMSWAKLDKGAMVKWIGADVAVLDRFTCQASLPPAFIAEVVAEARRLRQRAMNPLEDVRRFAGKCSWATGVGPALRNFLEPLWAVIGETARQEEASRRAKGGKHKWGKPWVHTVRFVTTLNWLLALMVGRDSQPAMQRTLDWRVALGPIGITVTVDASPWGLGAVLSTASGCPLAWLAAEVSDMDCTILKVQRGDCRAQAALEGLALLIALREWAPWWESQRLRAHVRSDSAAALGAAEKMASPTYAMNLLARELALDVAWSRYGVELVTYGHVAGPLNKWADALSRLNAPTEKATVPEALLALEPTPVVERRPAWWLSFAGARGALKRARRA
jgi:hypothetical protein